MPRLEAILETALYVDDLSRARAFYEERLGLHLMRADVGAGCQVVEIEPHRESVL